ncbi:helix-turn-helix domain-containing protein [Streptomyces sp. NPDC090131]|uniref:helix-turn-helix domain-containing protein n=1 Tax=Streptomyces sp. NPDC090131 TaxID=3365954 RepID=UPI003829200B
MIAIVNEEWRVAARPLGVVGGADLPGPRESARPSSTVRQLLGGHLKGLRKAAGLKLADVCAAGAVSSVPVLSRIETGKTNVTITRSLVNGLLALYKVDDQAQLGSVRKRLEQLLADDSEPWWSGHDGLVVGDFGDLLHMEAVADRITVYENMFVPGLLQVPAYMEAVMSHACLSEAEREQVDRRRRLRLERQRLLEAADAPEFTAIIDEAVLHRTIGSVSVMREQLRALFNLCENRESIHIRVYPSSAWAVAQPMTPSLTLLQFPREQESPDMLYEESGGHGGSWLKEARVDMVKASLEQLRSNVLDKQQTLLFLNRQIERLVDR